MPASFCLIWVFRLRSGTPSSGPSKMLDFQADSTRPRDLGRSSLTGENTLLWNVELSRTREVRWGSSTAGWIVRCSFDL